MTVIDDEKDVLDAFSDYLELQGADIIGKVMMEKRPLNYIMTKNQIYLFLMFQYLSMIDSMREKIKESNDNSVVILITGDLTKDTENKAEELRYSAIIYKSFKIDKLLNAFGRLEKIR